MTAQLIHRRRFPVHHFVVVDRTGRLAPEALLVVARRHASRLAARISGNADNFTLIHNGRGVARCERPHVHIVCTRSRFGKGLMYVALGVKNVLASLVRRRSRHCTAAG